MLSINQICFILKGLTADAADPDLGAFDDELDTDYVINRAIAPMIDRVIDYMIELDYFSSMLCWAIASLFASLLNRFAF